MNLHRLTSFPRQRLLLALTALWSTLCPAALPEYDVKAVLLVKIAKFVTWPAAAETADAFRLCVLGTDPFGTGLDSLRSQRVSNRPVSVMRLQSVERAAANCDLVFVSGLDGPPRREILDALAQRPILTVSDLPDFARHGGMVAMETRDRKIGFEVNVRAYRQAGLEVSSQLLSVAKRVEDR
jgi:hypothetical protein